MEFSYQLTGVGWADATVADSVRSAVITASYSTDALGDLLQAVGVLLEGGGEARCSWDTEPAEFRWIFRRAGDEVRLGVLFFGDIEWDENGSPGPDEEGEVIFATRQPLLTLASAVANGATDVL